MIDDTQKTIRIAMWSGPRNLSTAMMRSFENRPDCKVCDEPFYAAYLKMTGLVHPMREEIINNGESDWRAVIEICTGLPPREKTIFYQKHMTHHMLPEIDRKWIGSLTNVFLIRDPARVVASYTAKRDAPTLEDIGFKQQYELFEQVAEGLGEAPAVIDAATIRTAPEASLRALCAAIGITFNPGMLHWPAGSRTSDGVWGTHWYDAVNRSTGFAPPETGQPELTGRDADLAELARPHYDAMKAHEISIQN